MSARSVHGLRSVPASAHPLTKAPPPRLVLWLLGPDKLMRSRTLSILLCAAIYFACTVAAFYGAEEGIMRPFSPWLIALSMPAHAIFYALVRSGLSIRLRDPAMMVVQNVYALLTIGFAYTALYPNDRGAVLVLLPLVTVFGMFTHTPSQSVLFSTGFLVVMAMGMAVLSHIDPVFYPPQLELLRFELIVGTLPTISFAAYQITSWRAKATTQREALRQTLSKVQELATHDVLTGLYNRHFMQDKLNECIARFDRYGERFTTVLIDLDHFKRINDQHGHKVGDQALLAFAQAGSEVFGEVGVMARWGGEEFLVLLPNTGTTKTLDLLRQLRVALAQRSFSDAYPALRVGFSAGIAIHDRPASLAATLERADRGLYRAKHEGRGRDVIASQVNA